MHDAYTMNILFIVSDVKWRFERRQLKAYITHKFTPQKKEISNFMTLHDRNYIFSLYDINLFFRFLFHLANWIANIFFLLPRISNIFTCARAQFRGKLLCERWIFLFFFFLNEIIFSCFYVVLFAENTFYYFAKFCVVKCEKHFYFFAMLLSLKMQKSKWLKACYAPSIRHQINVRFICQGKSLDSISPSFSCTMISHDVFIYLKENF